MKMKYYFKPFSSPIIMITTILIIILSSYHHNNLLVNASSSSIIQSLQNKTFVEETCKKLTQQAPPQVNYDYCVRNLSRKYPHADTVEQLGSNAIAAAAFRTGEIINDLFDIWDPQPRPPPQFDPAFQRCWELYSAAEIDLLPVAKKEFQAKNYDKALNITMVTYQTPSICENGLNGSFPVLTWDNNDFSQGVALAVTFCKLLGGK